MVKLLSTVKKGFKKGRHKAQTAVTVWTKQRHLYAWHLKYSPVEENTILFESFHGKTMSDSPLYMLRTFLDDPRSHDFHIYYATTYANLSTHRQLAESLGIDRVDFVTIGSWKYSRVIATAKYFVNNSSFPSYFIRRPEQRYIQTWHGTPLKTLGKQMRHGIESMYNVQHNFLQASVLTFPNEFTRDVLMRDYNLQDLYTGRIALVGYPRNQVFFDDEKAAQIRERYGLNGIETFAYMPTWRGVNNYTVDVVNYRAEVLDFFEKIDAVLRDDQRMYVNFHSMVAAQFGDFEFEHIMPFPADADNYEFLNAMDALITDYSSVFFDYSLTRRPIILFAYDERKYLEERGMYLQLDELPFPKVSTIEDLVDMISSGSYRDIDYSESDYARKFLAYDSAENARTALDLLFERERPDVPVTDCATNKQKQWRMVQPANQGSLADIRTACEATDPERDIILFTKTKFNQDKSKFVHDNYRDGRNYIFVNKAYACTAIEQILLRYSERMREKVLAREPQRNLPNLNLDPVVCNSVYAGKVDTSFLYTGEPPQIEADVPFFENTPLSIDVLESMDLKGIALTYGHAIIAHEDLTQAEIETRHIENSLNLIATSDGFGTGGRPFVYVDGIDKETGEYTFAAVVTGHELELFNDDRLQSLYGFTHGVQPDGEEALYALYQNAEGFLHVIRAQPGKLLALFKYSFLDSVTSHKGNVRIRLHVRNGEFTVKSLLLRQRGAIEPTAIRLPFTTTEKDGWLYVESEFDPTTLPFTEIYWDAFLELDYRGLCEEIPVRMGRNHVRHLKLGNQQWRIGEDKVLFTHIKKGPYLSFVFRDYYPTLDTYGLRCKEMAALVTYRALRPYWRRKRVWLVFEKYCALAQDNGYYFFKYCMDLPEEQRKHIYYVIDKSKPDYANVAQYDSHVLDFMSFKHILYTMVANLYIASDSRTHLYVWRNKPSFVRNYIGHRRTFFLQHGVTAMKAVANLFGKNGSSPMSYFLTTSLPEQNIIVENFGYKTSQAPILGFSRWDVLQDRSSKEKPCILLMPTWRGWLEEQSDEVFRESEYFQAYSSLINSPRLAQILEKYDATLRFYIHPKLGYLINNFGSNELSPRVQLIEQGSEPLNEIMMECNALITDYSSVCWDMLYMDKPIVYYQFDQELYEETVGSYVDLNNDLPGDVCMTESQVFDALEACAKRGFTLTDEHAEMASKWFAYKDTKNRQRTYNFIISKGL